MKSHLGRATALSLHVLLVAFCVAIFGAAGAFAAVLNPYGVSAILGVSYAKVNTTTVTDLTTLTAKAREELWVRRIVFGSDRQYQDNPFADGMMGKPGQGKAVTSITDTQKVAGNTVNIPTVAGFGGPGVAGEGDRIGAEQKIRIGNFQVSIGRYWFGVGFTSVARDETVIGGRLDELINDGLRQQMSKKKSDDIMRKMIQRGGIGTRNHVFPDGATSLATLKSAHVMSTSLITKGATVLSSLGAKPMKVARDASGSTSSKYVLLGTNIALQPLDTESAYLDARLQAGVRGDANPIFNGVFDDWLGHGIYRWEQVDHGNHGPIGSLLLPRAFLGNAITGATTGSLIKGGGSAAAAAITPAPMYFENFSNAAWTFFNNTTIAADAATTRHVIIINPDGSYGVFPYIVNDGNKLTLSGARITIGVGTETSNLVEGALVHECNILGTTIGRHLFLGQEAVVCGAGSINGNKADPQMGKRTEEHRNHDMDHGIGIEAVWGCEAVQRADGAYPGFAVITTAVPVSGAPTIV